MTAQTYLGGLKTTTSSVRLVVDTDGTKDRVELYTTGTTRALIDVSQAEAIVKQLVGWLAQRAGLVSPLG